MSMSSRRWCLAVLLLFAFLLPLPEAEAREEIRSFDVSLALSSDGSMVVTESLLFNVENETIVHGIRRRIPVVFRRQSEDIDSVMDVTLQAVELDGQKVKYEQEQRDGWLKIRIGDRKSVVKPGLHKYLIKYYTQDCTRFFEDHDEMYWNVTGEQWQWPICSASFRMSLPDKKFGEGFSSVEWYAGAAGGGKSKETYMKNAAVNADNSVTTTRTLGPGEGFTVVYSFPGGLVSNTATGGEDLAKAGRIGLATLAVMLLACFLSWLKWGRDPKLGTIIPLFDPPPVLIKYSRLQQDRRKASGLAAEAKALPASPAFMRFTRSLDVDTTAFASVLLDLAVKGWLVIGEQPSHSKPEKKVLTLTKQPDGRAELTVDELLAFDALGDRIELCKYGEGTTTLEKAYSDLKYCIMTGFWRQYRRECDIKWMLPCFVLYAAGVAALVFAKAYFNITVAGLLGFLALAGGFLLSMKFAGGSDLRASLWGCVPAAFFAACMTVCGRGSRSISLLGQDCYMAAAALPCFFLPLMNRRTQAGAEMQTRTEGLALYLGTAERNRLEAFNPPEETPERLERFLPYALALDTAKTWADKFAKDYVPVWFQFQGEFNDTGALVSSIADLNRALDETVRSCGKGTKAGSVSGSSSGSGGGGSVGGGRGGGGGEGW